MGAARAPGSAEDLGQDAFDVSNLGGRGCAAKRKPDERLGELFPRAEGANNV
jgi:hypothetical protein